MGDLNEKMGVSVKIKTEGSCTKNLNVGDFHTYILIPYYTSQSKLKEISKNQLLNCFQIFHFLYLLTFKGKIFCRVGIKFHCQ